jgi:hypothetical protein
LKMQVNDIEIMVGYAITLAHPTFFGQRLHLQGANGLVGWASEA